MLAKVAIFAAIVIFFGGAIAAEMPITAYRKDIGILVAVVLCLMLLFWQISLHNLKAKEDPFTTKISDLEVKVSGLEVEKAHIKAENDILKGANDEWEAACNRLKMEASDMTRQIQALFNKENELNEKLADALKECAAVMEEKVKFEKAYTDLLIEHDNTSDELTEAKDELVKVKATIGGLTKVGNDLRRTIKELREKYEGQQDQT